MWKERKWPADCAWPEPIWNGEGQVWDLDLAEMMDLDEDGQELLDIKAYMDDLVRDGLLNPDYSLNEDYLYDNCDENEDEDNGFTPDKGVDYWDDGFDIESWEEDLASHINMLKIEACTPDPISFIREVTGYTFINENLARQAFTRRAFGLEYGVGNSEELEFYGDALLNTVVSRELFKRFSKPFPLGVESPYQSYYTEGELSKLRQKFVSKDHLAARAAELGLDQFILYGSEEKHCDAAREDMMEALIGAVATDAGWDMDLLADVVDRLICLQLDDAGDLLRESSYEQFNRWHQKHFRSMPEYMIDRNHRIPGEERYDCTLRYLVPENDKGIWISQIIFEEGASTRSSAREQAAKQAIGFLQKSGLWINLQDAGIEPRLEDAINQLQELYQKKNVEQPAYSFEEREICGAEWYCSCTCSGMEGFGTASAKTKAKKKAAFMTLIFLMKSAGICKREWEQEMWKTLRTDDSHT